MKVKKINLLERPSLAIFFKKITPDNKEELIGMPTSESAREKKKEDLFESYTGMMSHEF